MISEININSSQPEAAAGAPIRVLCVDDNPEVADAVRIKIDGTPSMQWMGWLPDATRLEATVQSFAPHIVLLDIDLPGLSPFDVMERFQESDSATRVIMFTGLARRELIDRAVEAGAWGYVCKNDGADALIDAILKVAAGEFALSPEARAVYLL